MSDGGKACSGGCLCGALRYEAHGEPLYAGYCYCADCRKASGSGFIPFIGFPAQALRFSGEAKPYVVKAEHGGDATRNSCPVCGGLVFGGEIGQATPYTIYAGSLDDPAFFKPSIAIFARSRPSWAPLPEGLHVFEALPVIDRAER